MIENKIWRLHAGEHRPPREVSAQGLPQKKRIARKTQGHDSGDDPRLEIPQDPLIVLNRLLFHVRRTLPMSRLHVGQCPPPTYTER